MLEKGVAVSSPDSLAKGWALKTLAFDKTGTLTEPESSSVVMKVRGSKAYTEAEIWALVAQLTENSHHPLAVALFRASCSKRGLNQASEARLDRLGLQAIEQKPGLGMQGRTANSTLIRLGSASFVGGSASGSAISKGS